jgi:hypothetical protein
MRRSEKLTFGPWLLAMTSPDTAPSPRRNSSARSRWTFQRRNGLTTHHGTASSHAGRSQSLERDRNEQQAKDKEIEQRFHAAILSPHKKRQPKLPFL